MRQLLERAGSVWRRSNTTARATVAGAFVVVLIGGTVLATNEDAQRAFLEATSLSAASPGPAFSSASPEVALTSIFDGLGRPIGREYFMRGSDNQIWGRKQTSYPSWEALGGGLESYPATSVDGNWVFAKAGDQAIWYRHRDSGVAAWGSWTSLGGVLTSAPAVASLGNDRYVFARGTDDRLWFRQQVSGGAWLAWTTMGGGAFTSAPAAVYHPGHNAIYVFGRGTDNAIYFKRKIAGQAWDSDWQGLGGVLTSAPTAAIAFAVEHYGETRTAYDQYTLYVLARGTDNRVWYRAWASGIARTDGSFGDWHAIPDGYLSSAPSAITSGTFAKIEIRGRGLDNRVYRVVGGVINSAHLWGAWAQDE